MKKILYITSCVLFSICFISNVQAAASLTVSSSTVTKGNSFTTYVKLTSVAAWEIHLTSTGPVSGCTINDANASDDASNINKTIQVTCTTTDTGTIQISLSGNTTTESGSTSNVSGTKTVNVVEKKASTSSSSTTTKSTKSSDNYLSSLSIEGLDLSFDKDKTDYTITAPYGTEKINISASKNHDKASISGDGEKEVQEGENKFEVVVTAENGSKKTYTINIIVDSKPINVTLDGKQYTIVKKEEDLPDITPSHELITLTIEEQEVKAYRIEEINYVLVGLRDEDGNTKLYKFDSYKDEVQFDYTLYQEIHANDMTFIPVEIEDIPSGYQKDTITIDDQEFVVYKSENSEFYLIYAINLENGNEGWYQYDKEENTFQRYIEKEDSISTELIKKVFIIIATIFSILIALIIALSIRLRKLKKLVK